MSFKALIHLLYGLDWSSCLKCLSVPATYQDELILCALNLKDVRNAFLSVCCACNKISHEVLCVLLKCFSFRISFSAHV